jgi:hypothetical protein
MPTEVMKPLIVSAPEMTTRSLVEKKAFYAKMKERMKNSPLKILTFPAGWHPYWARKNDESETARLDMLGFRVVRELDKTKPRYKANGLKEDGTYQMGDVILMECPEDEYQFYRDENAEKARQLADGAAAAFKSEATEQGVPTFEVDEHNKPITPIKKG